MAAVHRILIVEDEPQTAAVLRERVVSMDFEVRVASTLEEARAIFAEWTPCAILQDMQIPRAAGSDALDTAGESNVRSVRAESRGPYRVVVVIVTAFRADPDFVWKMARLEADDFCEKSRIAVLPDKLRDALKANGREDHARCAWCNAESAVRRESGSASESGRVSVSGRESVGGRASASEGVDENDHAPAAILYSHERRDVTITRAEVDAISARRADYDLFLDFTESVEQGFRAGFRDHGRVFRELHLGEMSASIIAELVQQKRAIRADAMKRFKHAGHASAVRLIQQARKEIDVRVIVGGKESRTRWRAFHTVGGKGTMGFAFEPPVGFRYAVMVKG